MPTQFNPGSDRWGGLTRAAVLAIAATGCLVSGCSDAPPVHPSEQRSIYRLPCPPAAAIRAS